jgi:copper chaperone NosL
MRRTFLQLVRVVLLWTAACSPAGRPPPAELDPSNEQCRFCRMAVSDPRSAAQITAPSEEPLFFDDIGCLKSYLEEGPSLSAGATAYVADHRTKEWVSAASALYVRSPSVETPMGSGLLAYADASSRDADPEAIGGSPLSPTEVLGPSGPPDGRPER